MFHLREQGRSAVPACSTTVSIPESMRVSPTVARTAGVWTVPPRGGAGRRGRRARRRGPTGRGDGVVGRFGLGATEIRRATHGVHQVVEDVDTGERGVQRAGVGQIGGDDLDIVDPRICCRSCGSRAIARTRWPAPRRTGRTAFVSLPPMAVMRRTGPATSSTHDHRRSSSQRSPRRARSDHEPQCGGGFVSARHPSRRSSTSV